MAVVRGEVSLPGMTPECLFPLVIDLYRFDSLTLAIQGPVPEQLATAFAQCQETEPEGPPSKRRKLADGETSSANSPRSLDSNARRPIGYITLARILLDLVSVPSRTLRGRGSYGHY